jgi:hypothetical protein
VPVTDGVPLIVIVLLDQAAETPVGNPEAVPIPVALVVPCVIFVNTVFTVSVGVVDAAAAAQAAATVIVPIAFKALQLVPVSGIV